MLVETIATTFLLSAAVAVAYLWRRAARVETQIIRTGKTRVTNRGGQESGGGDRGRWEKVNGPIGFFYLTQDRARHMYLTGAADYQLEMTSAVKGYQTWRFVNAGSYHFRILTPEGAHIQRTGIARNGKVPVGITGGRNDEDQRWLLHYTPRGRLEMYQELNENGERDSDGTQYAWGLISDGAYVYLQRDLGPDEERFGWEFYESR